MATYNNPFDKAAAFWNKYYPLMLKTGGSEAFWNEVFTMGAYFKNRVESDVFIILVGELERIWKALGESKGATQNE